MYCCKNRVHSLLPPSKCTQRNAKIWVCFEGAFAEAISAVARYFLNTESVA